jgi:hypothetical protein
MRVIFFALLAAVFLGTSASSPSALAIERFTVECTGSEKYTNPLNEELQDVSKIIFTIEVRNQIERTRLPEVTDSAGKKSKSGRYYSFDVNMWSAIYSADEATLILDDLEADGRGTYNKIDRQSGSWMYLWVDRQKPEYYRSLAANSQRPKSLVDSELRGIRITTIIEGTCKRIETKIPPTRQI